MEGEIPKRVSVDRASQVFFPRYADVDVYLDGERIDDAIEADVEAGRVLVYRRGQWAVPPKYLPVEELRGVVELRWKS